MRVLASVITFALALSAGPAAQADLGPARPTYEVSEGRLVLPAHMTFAFKRGTAEIEPKTLRAIFHVARFLEAKEGVTTLRIEGHADITEGGTAEAAQALSEQRAMAIARAIVERGAACGRLLPVGFGDTKRLAPVRSPSNTRIEVHLAGSNGRAIGGAPMDGGGKVAGDPCPPAP